MPRPDSSCCKIVALAFAPVCLFPTFLNAQQAPISAQDRSELQRDYAIRERSSPETMSRIELLHHLQEIRAIPDYTAKNYREPLLDGSMSTSAHVLQHVLLWNKAALDMTALDHTVTPYVAPAPPTFAEQNGPTRTIRAMAIVHLAMFEALNTVRRRYPSYHGIQAQVFLATGLKPSETTSQTVSEDLAIEEAAFATLAALYPAKQPILQANYRASDVLQIMAYVQSLYPNDPARASAIVSRGVAIGQATGQAVLKDRANDGSQIADLHVSDFANTPPPAWTTDPLHPSSVALGSSWYHVRPFVLATANQFPVPPPPATGSDAYIQDVNAAAKIGGDPNAPVTALSNPTPTVRTPDQTFAGQFWGYDGTALLCAPPRLYNMVATSIATREKVVSDPLELARLLATVNIAMMDSSVAGWTSKYTFLRPRPVTGLRALGGDLALWTPLGAPQTNSNDVVNFTPPFPAYPSGHAFFGGALFQALRAFYNVKDDRDTAFTFVSDEYNGVNRDADGNIRPLMPRCWRTFGEAEQENALSRIYIGIHWLSDASSGILEGNQVADYVSKNLFH